MAQAGQKRSLHKLTAREVATISKVGRHSDGGGLFLSVDKAGRRRWVFMSWRGGRQVELGLGSAKAGSPDAIGLGDARKKAATIRGRVEAGESPRSDPVQPVAQASEIKLPTFGECATAYIEMKSPTWRNEKHRAQWKSTLDGYAAALTERRVDQLEDEDILAVLEPIWTLKPETASRLRGRIESVLDYARAKKLRGGENPARWRGHLEYVLPARQRLSRGHHSAMPYQEVPDFFSRISGLPTVSHQALRFTILTGARSGETRGATWGEVDLQTRLWTVPAERMKAGREHQVPLSDTAVAILASAKPENPASDETIFRGPRTGRPLSDMTLSAVLRHQKLTVTVHGFRSSFRDWAGDCSEFDRDTMEAALAHSIRDQTERAYRRGSALEKRRQLMDQWASFCTGQSR